jgi:hypothetical protein
MIIGLSIATFTIMHVVISRIAIVAGLVVLGGVLTGQRLPLWTIVILTTTILISVTGFTFPITAFTPAASAGIVAMVRFRPLTSVPCGAGAEMRPTSRRECRGRSADGSSTTLPNDDAGVA